MSWRLILTLLACLVVAGCSDNDKHAGGDTFGGVYGGVTGGVSP